MYFFAFLLGAKLEELEGMVAKVLLILNVSNR
jgi:hypothetical protein